MNAFKDLIKYMEKDESIEAIVFGPWGWDGFEETTEFVPKKRQGIVLTIDEAKNYMKGWTFECGFGAPLCYATYIWTNKRVIWVTQYDGSTTLCSAPRNPTNTIPDMPGG